jgi:hypothetical protein
MISGVHVMIFSKDAEADRAFLRDVVGIDSIDAGHGWMIFKLPPAELGVHPGEQNDVHQFYLMTDNLDAEIETLNGLGAETEEVGKASWGRFTALRLPGGGKLGLYEAHHARP